MLFNLLGALFLIVLFILCVCVCVVVVVVVARGRKRAGVADFFGQAETDPEIPLSY